MNKQQKNKNQKRKEVTREKIYIIIITIINQNKQKIAKTDTEKNNTELYRHIKK